MFSRYRVHVLKVQGIFCIPVINFHRRVEEIRIITLKKKFKRRMESKDRKTGWTERILESRRTFKICSERTAGKSAGTVRENINSRRIAGEGERREERKKATTFGSSWKFVYTTLSRTVMHYALETDWPEIFGLYCSSRRNSITTRHSGALSTDLSDILCVPEV